MDTSSVDPFTVLTVAAGLALAVERIIEAIKHIIDARIASTRADVLEQGTETAKQGIEQARKAVERAQSGLVASSAQAATTTADDGTPHKPMLDVDGIKILPATPRPEDKARRVLFYQLFAVGLGMVFAGLFNVHLFHAFFHEAFNPAADAFLEKWVFVDELMTGLVIGGGSQPVHLVVSYLTQRQKAWAAR